MSGTVCIEVSHSSLIPAIVTFLAVFKYFFVFLDSRQQKRNGSNLIKYHKLFSVYNFKYYQNLLLYYQCNL